MEKLHNKPQPNDQMPYGVSGGQPKGPYNISKCSSQPMRSPVKPKLLFKNDIF